MTDRPLPLSEEEVEKAWSDYVSVDWHAMTLGMWVAEYGLRLRATLRAEKERA